MTRPAEARATTMPERNGPAGRHPGAGETRRAMKLVNGGARPAPQRRSARLSLEAKVLLTSVAGLCLLGLPIVLSASAPGAILAGGSPWSYVIRQCIYMGFGVSAAVVVSRTPVAIIRKLRFVLPLVALGLLVVVFMPGIGHYAGGSSRWIGIGPIQLQPSELVKVAMVVFAADMLARRAKRRDQWNAFVRPLLSFMAVAAVLIVRQPDLGTAIVLGCITFSMLFAAGTRLRLLVVPGGAVCAIGAAVALSATYSRDRLLSFVNPFAHASTSGYQVVQSLATLGLGGVTGSGVGGVGHALGVPSQCAHRLRLRRDRRQLRPGGSPRRPRGLRRFRLGRLPDRGARAGPVRAFCRDRGHLLGAGAGGDQHRRCR